MDERKIRTLVLSGGSTRGIALLGGIQCLADRGVLVDVDTYIGCSIGSIIGYLLILGYSAVEIMVMICKQGFMENILSIDVSRLFRGEKAVSGYHGVQEFLEKCTVEKIGRFVTFSQLHEITGKSLVCSTYNLCRSRIEYMSLQNHPDMPVLVAVRMSCSLPLLFDPMPYMGDEYVDGALGDDFPMRCADLDKGDAVGIFLKVMPETTASTRTSNTSSENLFLYVNSIFENFITVTRTLNLREFVRSDDPRVRLLAIPIPSSFTAFRFLLTTKDKFDLFSHGYEHARLQVDPQIPKEMST